MRQFGAAAAILGLAALTTLTATTAAAQEPGGADAAGYVSAFAGPAWAAGNSTGSILFEGGVRVAPHVMVFGNLGRFANLQGDLQPTIDATTAALANEGVNVTGQGSLPAWYGLGGLRVEIPTHTRVIPYAMSGVGAARLNPSAQFMFSSGTLPDGSTPALGTDITASLTSVGAFTPPPSSTALMVLAGGGVQIPVVPHWAVDVGYRYSHIAADSTLSAAPLNTNVLTFGIGYRF